jgi:tripartite-type tricarboxylate transporter receptor subunit TctC
MDMMSLIKKAALALAFAAFAAPALAANAPVDFYKDKTLTIYVGVEASSGYALDGRLLGQFFSRHVPGHPTAVVKFMPGAATLVLANYLYNVAPRDGTVFGLIHERMGLQPLIDPTGIKYDALKFNWIGAMSNQLSVCFVWHESSVQTIEDAKTREVLVAGTNVGGSSVVFPRVLNETLGTKFKVVRGYRGTDEINLALERGEAEGRCGYGWGGLKATKPDWVRDNSIRVIMQMGLKKAPDLPDIPLIVDVVKDPANKQALDFLLGSSVMSRPFVAPPGMPKDRVKILRDAFDATISDPDFLAQGAKQNMELSPISGVEIQDLLVRLYATPPAVIEQAKSWGD